MATSAERYPGLQINEDLEFEIRDWRAQRVAWLAGLLLLLLGVAGLFGPGPLSHQRAEAAAGQVSVDHLRWARRGAEAGITVRIDPALVREDGRVGVVLPTAYFEEFELRAVTPQPERVEANGEQTRFLFAAPAAEGPVSVEFDLRGRGMGPVRVQVLVEHTPVGFWQFLWP